MLKRRSTGARFLYRLIHHRHSHHPKEAFMAAHSAIQCRGFHGLSSSYPYGRSRGGFPFLETRTGRIDAVGGVNANGRGSGLTLKNCLDTRKTPVPQNSANDAFGMPRAVCVSHQQLLRDDLGLNLSDVPKDDSSRGSSLRFPEFPFQEKVAVAVDVDEVLGNFVSALNRFIADRYSLNHSVSEYYVYEFFKIWNCSRDEADFRVHEFFKTPYFKTGIYPIPGAQRVLHRLSKYCNLSVVTSRQNVIKDHTIEWIEKHFPGLFQEIHFGNHFALDGESRPKSEICKSMGAKVLIDDNPRYAIECAGVGIRVLLFDYENSYPWCKTDTVDQHPLVTRVHNWEEVEQQLVSWILSQ